MRYHRLLQASTGFMLLGITAAAAAEPGVREVRILTPFVDVARPPAAPQVEININGSATSLQLTWTGPTGQTFLESFSGVWTGKTVFQASDPSVPRIYSSYSSPLAFNLYTQPGTWSLTKLYICNERECRTKQGEVLGTITIKNPNKPDLAPPVIVSAAMDPQDVTNDELIARGARIKFKVTDDVSGVSQIFATTKVVHNDTFFFSANAPLDVVRSGTITAWTGKFSSGANFTAGKYPIDRLSITDNAGNSTVITDANTISQLFGGQPALIIK